MGFRAEPREEVNEPLSSPLDLLESHGPVQATGGKPIGTHKLHSRPAAGSSVPDTSSSGVTFAEWTERSSWPLGTRVQHPENPTVRGQIVKRGGRQWSSRYKLPMVRWDGKIDAVEVTWERLIRFTGVTTEPLAATPDSDSGLPAVREPDEAAKRISKAVETTRMQLAEQYRTPPYRYRFKVTIELADAEALLTERDQLLDELLRSTS